MLSKGGAASRRQSTLSTASAGARPATGAGRARDPDSEDELWARTSAAAVSRAPSLFRPTALPSTLLQRRLSAVSTALRGAATPPARAVAGSDSEDEAWARAKAARRTSIAAPAPALPMSRATSLRLQAPALRRASAAAAAPEQAADRSEDSDEERWQRLKSRAQAASPAQGMPALHMMPGCGCTCCMHAIYCSILVIELHQPL